MTSWTSPKTWVASAALTAAELNTHVRDNLLHLKEQSVTSGAVLSADVSTSSGSFSDLTGLSFTCTSGKNYSAEVVLTYESSSTSGGPAVGFDHPGGTCHMLIMYAGETSATSNDAEAVSATDTGTGVATANTASANYFIRAWIRYQCTSTGTFTLRMKRNTAGTTTFHKGGRLSVVSD